MQADLTELGARGVAVPLHRGRTAVSVQTTLHEVAGKLVAQTTQIQAIRIGQRVP
jgi:hypothetical protein